MHTATAPSLGFLGILMTDSRIPRVPGDIGDPRTYPFPVRYRTVPGATLDRLIRMGGRGLEEAFLGTAWSLVREGAWAITGSCGFMILFQETLAQALPVPVLLSSLLQIPWILTLIGPSRAVGVITADGSSLSDEHLRLAGVGDLARVRVAGMEDTEAFSSAVLKEEGPLDSHLVEQEVKERALRLAKGTPELGAVLLECTNLGPYASIVRDALGIPVFDINTLIHFTFRAVRPPVFRPERTSYS